MKRVFLDANVLFSAAYRETTGLLRLWRLDGVELLTSDYAVQEATANLTDAAQHARLTELLKTMLLIRHSVAASALPVGIHLPEKDVPILLGAIRARATVLLTGDNSHFGRYFGKTVAGVRILPPAEFLLEMTLRAERHA